MCWVMPPASPAATSVSRMASSSEVLPWSTWPMIVITGGRSISSSSVSSKAGSSSTSSVAPIDLDLLVEGLGQHLDRLVGERLGERGHLAQLHQLLDHLGRAQLERLGDLLDGGAGAHLRRRDPPRAPLRPRLRLGLEIGLDPLRAAAAAAPAAGRLLRGRRGAIAPRGLRVDHHAPAPATRRHRRRRQPRAATPRVGRAPPPPPPPGAAGPPPAGAGAVAAHVGRRAAAPLGRCAARSWGRSVLKDARAAPLGSGAPHGLALGRADVGTGLGRLRRERRPWASPRPWRRRSPRLCCRLGLGRGRAGVAVAAAPASAFGGGLRRPRRPRPSRRPSPSRRRLRLAALAFAFGGALAPAPLPNASRPPPLRRWRQPAFTSRPAFCRTSSASLLVIPRSLAISWTRFFAIRR